MAASSHQSVSGFCSVRARMLGPMILSPEGARLLGALVEKQLTTPQQYPLTLAALIAASNQVSNRDPVVTYDESTVMVALNGLKEQKLVRFVLPSHGRSVVRYRHVLDEVLAVDLRQCALLAVLLLRGPQTLGELRARTDRMAEFDRLDEIEHELEYLASFDQPLTLRLGRRPGQKEERWACLLLPSQVESPSPVDPASGRYEEPKPDQNRSLPDTGPDLQGQLNILRSELAELRRDLDTLRDSLGG